MSTHFSNLKIDSPLVALYATATIIGATAGVVEGLQKGWGEKTDSIAKSILNLIIEGINGGIVGGVMGGPKMLFSTLKSTENILFKMMECFFNYMLN